MPDLSLQSSVSALSATACEWEKTKICHSAAERNVVSFYKRASVSSGAACQHRKEWSNENDLEHYSKAHSKQPECWRRCSGGSAQARVSRRETGV